MLDKVLHGVPPGRFARELYQEINEDDVFNGAAVLGFYLTLAVFPAVIFVMAFIPFLPIANVDQAIMDVMRQALPPDAADLVQNIVTEVTSKQSGGLLSFGALGTLWAASSGMYAIMQQLNITYDVKEGRGFLKARATAVLLSLGAGVLVVGAFTLIVAGGLLQDWLGARMGVSQPLLMLFAVFRWVMIVAALLLGFALIYYFGPDVEQDFKFVSPGAFLGVVLLIIASIGFAIYTANFADYSATYGSIGAVIVLMLWLYVAGLVILVGSEINALIEHYSPEGKEKGEKVEGQKGGGARGGTAVPPPPSREDASAGRGGLADSGRARGGRTSPVRAGAVGVAAAAALAQHAFARGGRSSGDAASAGDGSGDAARPRGKRGKERRRP